MVPTAGFPGRPGQGIAGYRSALDWVGGRAFEVNKRNSGQNRADC